MKNKIFVSFVLIAILAFYGCLGLPDVVNIESLTISSPYPFAEFISDTTFTLKVDAEGDGDAGDIDLYINGKFADTDTKAPYKFKIDCEDYKGLTIIDAKGGYGEEGLYPYNSAIFVNILSEGQASIEWCRNDGAYGLHSSAFKDESLFTLVQGKYSNKLNYKVRDLNGELKTNNEITLANESYKGQLFLDGKHVLLTR